MTTLPRLTELCLQQQKFQLDTKQILVHTQIEVDMGQGDNNKEATHVTLPESPAVPSASAAAPVTTILPVATISPERHSNANKYPHLVHFLAISLIPLTARQKNQFTHYCPRLLMYYIREMARN
jgi:hypothetical protein